MSKTTPEQLPLGKPGHPDSTTSQAPNFPPAAEPDPAPATPTLTQGPPASAAAPAPDQPEIEVVDTVALQRTTGVTAAELQVEMSTVTSLQQAHQALEIFELRAGLLEACRKTAIRMTSPEDWVLMMDRQKVCTGMLCGPGARKVAMVYGIRIFNMRPQGPHGFEPHLEQDGDEYRYVGWCDAYCRETDQGLESIECGRSSSESFVGRGSSSSALVAKADVRGAVYTLMTSKPVRMLAAMTRVPLLELDEGWEGTGKTSDACRKGSGFGSSGSRSASQATGEDIGRLQAELHDAIFALVDSDNAAARTLLGDVTEGEAGTKFEGKGRVQSTSQITSAGKFFYTWKRLAAHPDYGKQAKSWVAGLKDASKQAKDGVGNGGGV